MPAPIEILVHISAPSRGSDDARYRKEALGYLGFEVKKRHDVVACPDGNERSPKRLKPTIEAARGEEHGIQVTWEKQENVITSRTPVGEGGEDFDLQSFGSSFDATSSFCFPSRTNVHNSSRTNLELSPFLSRDVLTPTTIQIGRTPIIERPRTAPTPSSKLVQSSLPRRSLSDSWETPPSVIPDSQPSYSSSKHGLPRDTYTSPNPLTSSPSPKKRQKLDSAPRSLQSIHDTDTGEDIDDGAHTSEQALPPVPLKGYISPQSTRSSTPPPSAQTQLRNISPSLPLEIHPPPPPTSHKPFTTHLTQSLTRLASTLLPLDKHFQPRYTTRPLSPLERGHWLVPLPEHDPETSTTTDNNNNNYDDDDNAVWVAHQKDQHQSLTSTTNRTTTKKFWEYLTRFVGGGRAGWGVWCSREYSNEVDDQDGLRNHDKDTNKSIENNEKMDTMIQQTKQQHHQQQPPRRHEQQVIKIYCWGEIVGHIYLVLILASDRRIRGMGARWVDAGGEVVVQMA
ncbi:hypothetical protein MMC24_002235 [Lignoscripta atroalba]|nr:hypothetical protein [Lignoscripta atroalba]